MASRLSVLSRVGQQYLRYHWKENSSKWLTQWRHLHSTDLNLGITKLTMPALSPTMQEGTIVKWHKKEGDVVNPGDVLCEIQTDKAVLSLDTEEEGILAKILKPDDTKNIRVGELIALLVDEGDDWQNVEVPQDSGVSPVDTASQAGTAAAPAGSAATATSTPSKPSVHLGYGPAVRSLLVIYKIQAADVPATGPHGRLLKGDLLRYIQAKGLKPAPLEQVVPPVRSEVKQAVASSVPPSQPAKAPATPPAFASEGYTDVDLTSMRKTIAKRLTESKTTIPHSYASTDCRIDTVLKLRKDLAEDGIKVSVNDFIIKAAAVALQRVPSVNASVKGDNLHLMSDIDISVAVATPNGLITPIVKNAVGLGVQQISTTVKDLAARAREGKLQLNEFQGGSFTISNLGMFGISHFSAVINPPQASIMAVGGSRLVPSADDGGATHQTLMTVTLSSDARAVDDQLAAQFLDEFRQLLENPMLMVGSGGPKDLSVQDGEEKITFDKSKLFAS